MSGKHDPGHGYDQWLIAGGQGADVGDEVKERARAMVVKRSTDPEDRDDLLGMLGLMKVPVAW